MIPANHVRGITTELCCILDFTKLGIQCLYPIDHNSHYDVVLDLNGRFIRVQCKASRYVKSSLDAFMFNTYVTTRTTSGSVRRLYTEADIDYFYTSFNGIGYMVPIAEASNKTSFCLRFQPPKNSQKNVHYAHDYTITRFINTCGRSSTVEH